MTHGSSKSNPSNGNLLAILGILIAIAALLWTIYSDQSQNDAIREQDHKQNIQIDNQRTQIALSFELNSIEMQKMTLDAKQATPNPNNANLAAQFESTRQAINNRQQEIDLTLTAIAKPIAFGDCTTGDNIPPSTGMHPDIGKLICIPSGTFAWISSDPARFTIPGIYEKTLGGFTFALFGPVKFSITGVAKNNVWLDASSDLSLISKNQGKTNNLIYRDGKVCNLSEYNGTSCP